jgi:hypothetical protein
MDCRDFRRQYSAYRDAHDPELAANMDDHMEACPTCASYDRALREGVDLLRGRQLFPTPDFRARLEARLASGEVVPEALPPRVSTWAATATAALFAALVLLTLKEVVVSPPPVAAEQWLVISRPRLNRGLPIVVFERIPPAPRP